MAQDDFWVVINDGAGKAACRQLYAKGVSSTTSAFTGPASLVFPVFFTQKRNINSPNHHGFPSLDDFGRINQIAPYDVPARMVVVRLQSPRTRRAL